VVAFDYSNGVEANARINGPHERLVLAQGDIFSPPVKEGLFDRVYCVGVIQHTPIRSGRSARWCDSSSRAG
jgi:Methyltransferase domain